MNIEIIEDIAVLSSEELIIRDLQSALDLIATINYETSLNKIVIRKDNIIEDFFYLETKLAGDVFQKFMNYKIKMAIVGDFLSYESKSLNDFIYECNKGSSFFFVGKINEGIKRLNML